MNYRISIIIPCFGRPLRTERIINDIINQDINGWEAFIIGDGCDYIEDLILTGKASKYIKKAEENGNKIVIFNEEHNGFYGYKIYQKYKFLTSSPYIIFAGNDDTLLPNHFSHYLSGIEGTPYDLVYYNSFLNPYKTHRNSQLRNSGVGHSEIIVKKDSILDYTHTIKYDDDWGLIEFMINNSAKITKSPSELTTYIVNRVGNSNSDIID
jgi:glycosyltransferase involved in cell wall biosynthesis